MKPSSITVSITSDRLLVETLVPSQRMLEITVTAPDTVFGSERAPLNLALVLDRSGSMSGSKLEYIKQAACHVIDLLDSRDRVSVVAYDDEVQQVASGDLVTSDRREVLKQLIRNIQTGGSTNLSDGWLEGAEAVTAHLIPRNVNRVLLLTDGLANRGITDLEQLAHHAKELKLRGVSTSTFGVGYDFNEHLLEAMASQGGGHFFFIEHPRQIPEFFRQELGELLSVVAREACLTVRVPQGVAVTLLGDLPHEKGAERWRIPVGDLSAQQTRRFHLQALIPPGPAGACLPFSVQLTAVDTAGQYQERTAELQLRYASSAENAVAPLDRPMRERVAETEIATAQNQALILERQGQRSEAQAVMQKAVNATAPFAPPGAMADAKELTEKLAEGLQEPERKQRHAASYSSRNNR